MREVIRLTCRCSTVENKNTYTSMKKNAKKSITPAVGEKDKEKLT